ncbi:MAG: T9SS type A sorting domain-containing protein [Vicingaceae bacterium]
MRKIILMLTGLIISVALKASITVTNVNTTIYTSFNGTYTLDFDNNSTSDFSIEAYMVGVFNRIDVKMLSANSEIVSLTAATEQTVQVMNAGTTFGSAWQSTTTFIYHHLEPVTTNGMNNQYIALRLLKNGNYYYGWVQLTVPTTGEYATIINYAFEDTPNTLITAGQTVSVNTGVSSLNNENTLSVFPNPVQNTLTVKPANNLKIESVNIYKSSGTLVKNIKQEELQINVSDLTNGIYFIELIAENKRTIKKIIKN